MWFGGSVGFSLVISGSKSGVGAGLTSCGDAIVSDCSWLSMKLKEAEPC